MSGKPIHLQRGRAAIDNPQGRFERLQRTAEDDGWYQDDLPPAEIATEVTAETARSIISRNQSPDIRFAQSINPYRGCEHGCIYCYARPSHSFLDLSPGLDFETRLRAKINAAELLRQELAAPRYRCQPIALGVNTDCYQPIERHYRITRALLEVLAETRHPVTLITKSALIERDIDLLSDLAQDGLVLVFFSVATLDGELARKMDPRAATPARRLRAMATLAQANIPVGVMTAPLIPALNDADLEKILTEAHAHGARQAGYTVLRLPLELEQVFSDWLHQHFPQRAAHVLSLLRQMRDGRLNSSQFGQRMKGQGIFAELMAQRFRKTTARLGMNAGLAVAERTDLFRRPRLDGQMDLF